MLVAAASMQSMQPAGRARSNVPAPSVGRFGCLRAIAWSPVVIDVTTPAGKHVGPRRTSVSTP